MYADLAWGKVSIPALVAQNKAPIAEVAVAQRDVSEQQGDHAQFRVPQPIDAYSIQVNVGRIGSMVVSADNAF